jgi:hypothetical protein
MSLGRLTALAVLLCACGGSEAVLPDHDDPVRGVDAGAVDGSAPEDGDEDQDEDEPTDEQPQLDGAVAGDDGGPPPLDAGEEPPPRDAGAGDGGSEPEVDASLPEPEEPEQDPACFGALKQAGSAALCASCACGRCARQASACGADPACGAALACMHDNGCSGIACYCTGDLLGCALSVRGPCKDAFEAASGQSGEAAIKAALADASSALGKAQAAQACTRGTTRCEVACAPASEACHFNDLSCQQRYCAADPGLSEERAESALQSAVPHIDRVLVDGSEAWAGSGSATLRPGARVVLEGEGFGAGTHVDFSKLLIGNVRVLESDLTMYEQTLDIASQVHSETTTVRSRWPKDIVAWTDERIEFTVPRHVTRGPIVVQVQKREGENSSYVLPGEPHAVVDPLTMRITEPSFEHACDVVSGLSLPRTSNEVPAVVDNPGLSALVKRGREIFWSYDYNIGLTHQLRGLDWTAIMQKRTTDPVTGLVADPLALFGAYPTVAGEVPDEAIADVYFDPYPQKNPIPGLLLVLSSQKTKGNTRSTGYVGYRYAESVNPYTGDGQFIGFNCASCHGYRVTWQNAPASTVTKVIPGMPNPRWSMKWSVLGDFKGVKGEEPGPIWDATTKRVDKTPLIYAMPSGHGEHDLIRMHGEGSMTDNDYGFAPIAIPNVTYYLPIRRSLSHTEQFVGFEGSYIHSEEPDGALGSMDAASLQALTAYMAQLDGYDDQLRKVGLYRWLAHAELSSLHGGVSEGAFVQSGPRAYPDLSERLDAGAAVFAERCGSCHQDGVGQFTTEQMVPLHEVGRFFEPTVYHREMQSLRVTYLRDLYWVQHRGLLSDGHVRNLEDLVHPDRCTEGAPLYDRYYTLHAPVDLPPAGPDFPAYLPGENVRGDVFRVARSTDGSASGAAQNAFVERFRYFSRVPWDDAHYYWDYQKMRRQYGPWELGSAMPIGLPAAPHPWCAGSESEVADLVLYLVSL